MTVNRIWGVGNWIGLLPLGLAVLSPPVFAQIVPDNTLGTENSQVTSDVNVRGLPAERIDGGATRGSTLFHSFSEFNVNDGQRVYFSNPSGIDNILTRVTGANVSNILGTLGVDGGANLFLLNPNGILFGPNAQLDIQGSFFASTGSGFKFPDGSEFSATNPQGAPLLTMSVTPGVQYGTTEPGGTITNRGNLTVGEDLTLAGGNLDLQGQLQAGRDLTLQAQDTVNVRDTVSSPFVATSGRHLTMQGNQSVDIFALNHPQSQLQSGGNFSLISDGNISGDAHFSSGGNLSMLTLSGTPGNFVSLFDPIIRANGDVQFGDYTGVALKVEATGSIQAGNITITEPDKTIPVNDPDYATITGSPSVILRAGLDSVSTSNLPQNSGDTSFTGSSALQLGITVGSINTYRFDGKNGGDIILSAAKGNITATGNLNSSSFSSMPPVPKSGNGGKIFLTATRGNITTNGVLDSSSSSSSSSNGGAITLTAGGSIITNGALFSYSGATYNPGNGGDIALTAGGDITTNGTLSSFSQSGPSSPSATDSSGNGGAITLTAGRNITTQAQLLSFSESFYSASRNGGDIALTAGGDITTKSDFQAFSSSTVSSNSSNSGDGGAIFLRAGGNITAKSDFNSFSYSNSGNSGTGGTIFLSAKDGDIEGIPFARNRFLNSFSVSKQGSAGNGGDVSLEAQNTVSNLDILTLSSSENAKAGSVRVQGFGDLEFTNSKILTSGQLTLNFLNRTITLDVGKAGQSGDVAVISSGNLTFNNSRIESDTKGSASAGNVTIASPGLVTFNNSQIINKTSSTGQAGNISIKAGNLTLDQKSALDGTTAGTGRGGNVSIDVTDQLNLEGGKISTSVQAGAKVPSSQQPSQININAGNLSITNGGSISASVNTADSKKNLPAGRGNAGNINISVRGNTLLSGANSRISNAIEAGAIGQAGSITLNTGTLTATGGASIDSSIAGTATKAGGINVNATGAIAFSGAGTGISSELKSGGSGQGGTISLNTNSLTLDDRAAISATTSGQGTGGNININARTIKIQNNSALQSDSNTSAYAPGNISLQGTELISITNQGKITSESQNDSDNSGEIHIKANEGSVILNQATVSANNQGLDDAGDMFIDARDRIDITNGSTISGNGNYGRILIGTELRPQTVEIDNSKLTTTNNRDTSDAGDIFINARDRISIANTSQISADGYRGRIFVGYSPSRNDEPTATPPQVIAINNSQLTTTNKIIEGTKNAGSIFLSATDNTSIENKSSLSTFTVGSGLGGNIDIKTGSLLLNSSQLNGTTSGTGNAGAVTINAQNGKVELGQQSQISSAVQQGAAGNAGSITINTQQLTLGNDSQATVSSTGTGTAGKLTISAPEVILENSSRLAATTQAGSGGDIQLQNLSSLQLLNNSEISASTQSGKGGSLSVNAPGGTVALTNSRLKAEATQGGQAGNLQITANQLTLRDGSSATVSSPQGQAGNLSITANNLLLDRGEITAATGKKSEQGGANIKLQVTDLLLLRHRSLISATANGDANGGNIAIKAPFVIAVPSENSDIIANAVGGNGGQINITANRIFGLKQQNGQSFEALRGNRTSDISASSQFGLQGNINIQALSIDPSQGLTALPIDLIDPSNQITRSCGANANRQNQFVVTGRGGLPPSPDDLQTGGAFTPGWVTRENNKTNQRAAAVEPRATASAMPLLEAQGMTINAQGELVLTAQAATTTPHQSGIPDQFCSPPNN